MARQAVLALVATLVGLGPQSILVRAADAVRADKPVKLAVLGFPRDSTGSMTHPEAAAVLDLLTARLSAADGFILVERTQLDVILNEVALSSAGLSKSADVVRVGRMIKVDWFLLVSFPKESTNTVMGKILDASTGVVRDLHFASLEKGGSAAAEALAAFTVASRSMAPSGRLWIGFGGFEDLGLFNHYRDFGDQLRLALTRKYAGTRVSVVERSQVTPLLEELRLSLSGFTETPTEAAAAQAAFVLVDGLYQAFRDEQSKINLVLRMEWLGRRKSAVTIKELPGPPLEAKVVEAIDRFLAETPAAVTNSPTRQAEARAQLIRGREMARMQAKYVVPQPVVPIWPGGAKDLVPRLREAINAFESALFLDPENLEAKFCLAGCLIDPAVDQVEPARDYWREIVATSADAEAAASARRALAFSYVHRDDLQALELITALRSATTNLGKYALLNNYLRSVLTRLSDDGKVPPVEIQKFVTEAWRADCRLAEMRIAAGQRIDVYATFTGGLEDQYSAFKGTLDRRTPISNVVSNLVREFPLLEPYLVAAYARRERMPTWKEWHRRTLAKAAEEPQSIPDPTSYYSYSLVADLRRFISDKDYDWAERVCDMFERNGRKYLRIQTEKDDLDFLIGHVHFKRGRWDKAIATFEQIGSRDVRLPELYDVWGKGGTVISGTRAAAICREQMILSQAAPAATASKTTQTAWIAAPKPVQVFPGTEVVLVAADGVIWLTDRQGFYRYHPHSGELEKISARINPRVRRIVVHQNKIWIATADGLYAFDPGDRSVTTNSVQNGLLMPGVTALLADNDRMWMGFGGTKDGSSIGGFGYLKLAANQFVGIMSELPAPLAATPPEKALRGRAIPAEGAQRRYVTGLAGPPDGPLWVSTTSQLLQYEPRSNRWTTAIPRIDGAVAANVVANEDFVVVPCYEPSGWDSSVTNFGGVVVYDIRRKTYRRITGTGGLPNNKLYAASLTGNKAWLGGEGFLAMIDLQSARVEKVCKLASTQPVYSPTMIGSDLWFASGPGLYRIAANSGEVVTSQAPGSDAATGGERSATPVSAGEVRDMQSAREVLKKREEVYRIYKTREVDEYRELTTRFNAFIRQAARDFPLLEPGSRRGTNQFLELTLHKTGRGVDGFRFRGTLPEAADFGWIFAHEQPSPIRQWYITPAEETLMKGFTDFYPPKIAYTNAPWTGLSRPYDVTLQILHDGQIQPEKEYIIWIDFRDDRPARFFIAFDLFPASARHRSRSVLEGAFGLRGNPIPDRYR